MRTARSDSSTHTGGRGSLVPDDKPHAAPKRTRTNRATTKRQLVHLDESVWATDKLGEWLDYCEVWAREVLREHGLPDDLGPWHLTEQGEWRKPRHVTLEDWVKSPEHFATLDNFVKPMSAPWLAAKMFWQIEFARGALAAGDAAKAGLDCARLAMWASFLDAELSGHREAAEVGDAVANPVCGFQVTSS